MTISNIGHTTKLNLKEIKTIAWEIKNTQRNLSDIILYQDKPFHDQFEIANIFAAYCASTLNTS